MSADRPSEKPFLIAFLDSDRFHKPDNIGFNKIGYLTHSGGVIFPLRRNLVQTHISNILKLPFQFLQVSVDIEVENIEMFFIENFQSIDLFNLGLFKMLQNDVGYFRDPVKLPRLNPIDNQTRDKRWRGIKDKITEGDLLCTYDTKSFISKIISKVDRGPWSHCALYSGEGTVLESISIGVVERSLEVYNTSRYRIGLYRVKFDVPNKKEILEFARSKIGEKYSFKKALMAGIQKHFDVPRLAPTPNDLAMGANFELIAFV